ASATWDTPVRVSRPDAVADANVPDVAVDAAGNAIVVWHQGDGRVNHFDVWQAGYAAPTGQWSAAALASDGTNSAYNPKVALDTAGAGIAAWTQQQGDGTTVSNGPQDTWARPVATTGAWGAATRLNAVTGDVAWVYGQIAVAMDAQGNGAVLWVQGAPGVSPFLIHAARYTAAGGWQASTAISTSTLDASYGPQLAFDATGHGVAVWQQQTGVGAYAGVNRFDPAAGWGTPGALGTDVAGDVWDPHVAVDGAGNATAVWTQWDANGLSVTSSRSLAGGAWSASLRVADTPTDGYFTMPAPRVAANPSGQTLVVWGTNSY
ncbi:MAG TPA: hypothetical protein VKJ07_08080, partial [Mycobacteriales bacterium]|nr:hypothetical protein [Mycobacteriales bacterium]